MDSNFATMSTYSAFFSSGLFAPHNGRNGHSTPPGPVAVADIEMDSSTTHAGHPQKTPVRLRRRRSSLTLEASGSPIHTIKSPIRNAAAAGALQRHIDLNMHVPVSPPRNRSGSGSLGTIAADVFSAPASDENGLDTRMSRMRSGSLGNALRCVSSVHSFLSNPRNETDSYYYNQPT